MYVRMHMSLLAYIYARMSCQYIYMRAMSYQKYICHCQNIFLHACHVRIFICVQCHIKNTYIHSCQNIQQTRQYTRVCMSEYICHCQNTYVHSYQDMSMRAISNQKYIYTCVSEYISHGPLTEEIRHQIFGSRDLTMFLLDLLSDGDSIYTTEKSCEPLGIPVKKFLMCVGTPVKTCWKFWQS